MLTDFHAELKTLRLTEPFRIGHGTSTQRQMLRVHATRDGITAVGEAPFVPYYKDNPAEALTWAQQWGALIMGGGGASKPVASPSVPRAAKLAFDLLKLDLMGKAAGKSISRLWQDITGARWLSPPRGCRSFSIPADLDEFADKIHEADRTFSVLKLKLGSGSLDHDEMIVARARNVAPAATLIADVNGAWSVTDTAKMIPALRRWRLACIEQPISHDLGIDGWRDLQKLLPAPGIPLIADESAQTSDDVARLAGLVSGVNVKLLKCGGWHRAREMILAARVHGMKVMLGCMIESSIGVTAAAHLAGLADWIDLDGHLWIADDDYEGVCYDKRGQLVIPDAPGLGVTIRKSEI